MKNKRLRRQQTDKRHLFKETEIADKASETEDGQNQSGVPSEREFSFSPETVKLASQEQETTTYVAQLSKMINDLKSRQSSPRLNSETKNRL